MSTTKVKPSYFSRFRYLIEDEHEARACKDIAEDACQVVPGNARLMLLALVFSKIADTFASAKIVLPWLMAATGAPLFLTSLLVPIRESGSMLPQLLLGAYVRQKPVRKGFLVLGGVLQALIIAGFVGVAIFLDAMAAGIAIVLLTVLFSLARAISSIANKDVIGKTIPKKQRGRISGSAASLAGLVSIVFGAVLMYGWLDNGGEIYLLALAGACFAASAWSYGLIKEVAGATEGGVNAVKHALDNIGLLRKDTEFIRFVLVRGFMISSGLAAPYFVLMAQAQEGSGLHALGLLIVVSGVASFISGNIWGRFADHNSKQLITLTAVLTVIVCGVGAALAAVISTNFYLYLGLFFVLSVVHEGVRQGRKTYLVDMAGGNKRTDYVSVSNTLIGVLLLVVGVISGVIAQHSLAAVLAFFTLLSLVAAVLSTQLKSVSE
ncbi:MFS transporter [Neptunomonas sp. XY-337]|uniref:MFS transporter n=1 Tax=Neptunomonas sp. XY-337 TaxID=2561897 RepID=UPI0010AA43F5|nr:MFS transporter [Neptunomonas sp. XY-337]